MHELHAIVPNRDRTAILVIDGRLPVAQTAENRQADMLAALREAHGVRTPLLRSVRREQDDEKQLTMLFELDAPADEWTPRAQADWLPLASLDVDGVAPRFPDGLAEWLAEQRTGSVPPERCPWARSGWLERATAWVDSVATVEAEPRSVRVWPLSAMYVYETAIGRLYLKACMSIWLHEPAVTALLSARHPGSVPDVVATKEEEGWLLMREFGGTKVGELGEEATAYELRTAAELQRAWIGGQSELLARGAPHRPLDQLRAEMPALAHLCDRLEALGVPETLVHGDLHRWNAVIDEGRVVLFDWSDAAIAHPFLDLAPTFFFTETDPAARERMLNAYLEPWAGLASEADLRQGVAIGEVLGYVYQAISYRSITAAMEQSDRSLFDWIDWLGEAAQLAERL